MKGSGGAGKCTAEILAWLKDLPPSHVPDAAKDALSEVVQSQNMNEGMFTQYVQKVPPETCAPKHAMKLKAAWNNVLAEGAAKEVCRQNLDLNAGQVKAVRVDC